MCVQDYNLRLDQRTGATFKFQTGDGPRPLSLSFYCGGDGEGGGGGGNPLEKRLE